MLNFGSPSLFDNGASGADNAAVAIGDVYGYGIPDIVTATTSGVLSIAQGKGDGTFLTPVMVSVKPPAGTPLPTFLLRGQARGPGREAQIQTGRPYWTSSRLTLPRMISGCS